MCDDESNFCRCCMKENGKLNLFDTEFDSQAIAVLIENYAQCQISSKDQLPKGICQVCYDQLIAFHKFIKKFKEVQSLINSSLEVTEIDSLDTDQDEESNQKDVIEHIYVTSSHSTKTREDILCESNPGTVKVEILYDDDPDVKIENDVSMEEETSENKVDSEIFSKESNSSNEPKYCCTECEEDFALFKYLKVHCKDTGHKIPRRFGCNICSKKYSSGKQLKSHMLVHSKERPFKCDLCNITFNVAWNLSRHKRSHTGEKPFSCKVCGKGFAQRYNLTAHMRSHSEEPTESNTGMRVKVECKVCKRIVLKTSLNHHMKSQHEKSLTRFLCNICGKSFSAKFSLETHMNIHNKIHQCKVCLKPFNNERTLGIHILLHSGEKPHVCDRCGKNFRQKSHLATHMKTHTGERPYLCEFCDKSFAIKENLKVHERIHTGVRPYSCSLCGECFISLTARKKHEKGVHGINKKKIESQRKECNT